MAEKIIVAKIDGGQPSFITQKKYNELIESHHDVEVIERKAL